MSELFVENEALILSTLFVVIIPFITGAFLTLYRYVELTKNKRMNENLSGGIAVAGMLGSWVISVYLTIAYFTKYVDHEHVQSVVGDTPFLPMVDTAFKWGLMLDPLSVIFMIVLTTIATLIHIYATAF